MVPRTVRVDLSGDLATEAAHADDGGDVKRAGGYTGRLLC